jgi:hypothetical protein
MKKRWVLIGVLVASGCAPVKTTGVTAGGNDAESTIVGPRIATPAPVATPTPTPRKSDAAPTPTPSAVRRALSGAQRTALVTALDDMIAGGRASLLAGSVSQSSRLISNNGGSILSDNGLGYRTLAATTRVSETEAIVYVVTTVDDKNGIFKAYDKAGYKALPEAQREQALLDHFTWSDMAVALTSAGPPAKVDVTYNMNVVSSKRLPFTKDQVIKAREPYVVDTVGGVPAPRMVGWEIEFSMEVTGLSGTKDQARFKGVAAEADLEYVTTPEGLRQGFPKRLALSGSNNTGTYEGQTAGATSLTTTLEHASGAGMRTRLTVEPKGTGGTRRTIELPAEKLRVVLDIDADNKGSGELVDITGGPVRLGTIAWTTEGVGTVSLEGGESFQLRVF